jgi:hypothetical protein
MPDPPVSDHENEESEPEPEPQPEQARRRTPQQRARSETPQRRWARDRDPEDFNFMPQHANPGGNRNDQGQEDPNAEDNNENAAPNPPVAPHQGNAGQQQPEVNQQQQNVDQQMPNQGQQQVPAGQYQPGIQGQRQYPHYAQALDPATGNLIFPRLVPTPMRPLDVAHQYALDYTTPQTIKFYNKGIEKLSGEAFNGTLLFTWLIKVQDKALQFAWIPILTIEGKLLTQNFAEISLTQVRAHAQIIQDQGGRMAQNSEMLLCCLKNSITNTVYTKVFLQKENYTIMKQPQNEARQDGVCFLKVLIDAYHSNTRSSTTEVRKQLAHLDVYMKDVARGDVTKLCTHTRSLLYELNAAGETTKDLVTNLITALEKAPDVKFQRYFSTQVDLWSMKQKNWKEDGSDLMEEAELYYKEAKQTGKWGKKASNIDTMYAFQATKVDGKRKHDESEEDEEETSLSEIAALTAQLKEYNEAKKWEKESGTRREEREAKYKWKIKPPKDGESTTKKVMSNGKTKKYHWCEYHKLWTIHSPKECKRQPTGKYKASKGSKGKKNKYSQKKKAYMDVKAAISALTHLDIDSDDDSNISPSESEYDSNTSSSTFDAQTYSSEEEDSDAS